MLFLGNSGKAMWQVAGERFCSFLSQVGSSNKFITSKKGLVNPNVFFGPKKSQNLLTSSAWLQTIGPVRGFCDQQKLDASAFPPLLPKRLHDVVKMELLEGHTKEEIREIWDKFFMNEANLKVHSVGKSLDKAKWHIIKERATRCPMFVFPVRNEEDKSQFYVLFSEWQPNSDCVMTYLEDYRKDSSCAPSYFHLVVHQELEASKDVVLCQAEYLPLLSKQQANEVLDCCIRFYLRDDLFAHVEKFNLHPEEFDFYLAINEKT